MTRILVIDDDKNVCALLEKVFADLNYEVQMAHNGNDGLAMAKAEPPDMAIVDINMPGMNGYDVCTGLRADPKTHDVPILMLTGMTHLPAAMKSMATGANDYITKPFDLDEVVGRVQALLTRRGK